MFVTLIRGPLPILPGYYLSPSQLSLLRYVSFLSQHQRRRAACLFCCVVPSCQDMRPAEVESSGAFLQVCPSRLPGPVVQKKRSPLPPPSEIKYPSRLRDGSECPTHRCCVHMLKPSATDEKSTTGDDTSDTTLRVGARTCQTLRWCVSFREGRATTVGFIVLHSWNHTHPACYNKSCLFFVHRWKYCVLALVPDTWISVHVSI